MRLPKATWPSTLKWCQPLFTEDLARARVSQLLDMQHKMSGDPMIDARTLQAAAHTNFALLCKLQQLMHAVHRKIATKETNVADVLFQLGVSRYKLGYVDRFRTARERKLNGDAEQIHGAVAPADASRNVATVRTGRTTGRWLQHLRRLRERGVAMPRAYYTHPMVDSHTGEIGPHIHLVAEWNVVDGVSEKFCELAGDATEGGGESPLESLARELEGMLAVVGQRRKARSVAIALAKICMIVDVVVALYVLIEKEAGKPAAEVPCENFGDVWEEAQSQILDFEAHQLTRDPAGRWESELKDDPSWLKDNMTFGTIARLAGKREVHM